MPRGRPRQFDRDQALTSAMLVFWSKGYRNTSMTDLTAAMNIVSPSLYAAFGSKEQLYRAALSHYCAHYGGDMWKRLDREPTIVGAITGFLSASVDAFTDCSHPPGCMVVSGAQELGAIGDDGAAEFLRSIARDNHRQVAMRFERAVADGELASDVDASAAAGFFLALQSGLSHAARLGQSRDELAKSAELGRLAIEAMTRAG